MDKLVYQRSNNSKEPQKINFEFKDDITAYEFRNICVRMASALDLAGYNEDFIFATHRAVKLSCHVLGTLYIILTFFTLTIWL